VINFQFAHFMANAEHSQCRKRWAPPIVSRTADLTLMNVGSWAGVYCKQPVKAVGSHVLAALEWASMNSGAPEAHLVVRSVSTMLNLQAGGCHLRNSYASFANFLSRSMCPRYGASYFDSWQIEAPRFLHNCGRGNHHYSCVVATPDRGEGEGRAMSGEVGEAVAKSLLHYSALHHALISHFSLSLKGSFWCCNQGCNSARCRVPGVGKWGRL